MYRLHVCIRSHKVNQMHVCFTLYTVQTPTVYSHCTRVNDKNGRDNAISNYTFRTFLIINGKNETKELQNSEQMMGLKMYITRESRTTLCYSNVCFGSLDIPSHVILYMDGLRGIVEFAMPFHFRLIYSFIHFENK